MRVSFVIPTRNQAHFIRKCIDSCLAQQLPDYEIIVVDGLSTDGTQQILESYADRVRWVSEPDSGQSEAVNKGVKLARGDLIAWLNSDDYYPNEDVLKSVIATFDSDPDIDIVYGNGWMVDPHGVKFRKVAPPEISDAKELLFRSGFALQPAIFFRQSLFERIGGVDVTLHWAMDYDLWIRMMPLAKKIRFVAQDFACAQYHPGAKSVQNLGKQVKELVQLKTRHQANFSLSVWDWLRLKKSILSLYLYWLAVKLGLRKHT